MPEIALIASYYLLTAFPTKKALLFGESKENKLSDEIIRGHDIIIMPNFQLSQLADLSVDLFINTGSLSEMDYATVEEYISQIARTTRHYFFHENSDRAALNNSGHVEVPSSDFPIPKNIFKKIYKANSLWGGVSGRYREYLYARI